MLLSKREFLKGLTAGIGMAMIPVFIQDQAFRQYVYDQKNGYDTQRDYLCTFPYIEADFKKMILPYLHNSARLNLPINKYYEIRMTLPGDFGRDKIVGWYHNGIHTPENIKILRQWQYIPSGGYSLYGRYKTTA